MIPFFLKDTGCKHYSDFYKVDIQKFPGDGDIVLIKYQIDTRNISYSTYIFFKTDFVSKSNLSSKKSQETHDISKYPQRIHRVSIPEGDSSITPAYWSLSTERLGIVCTNPPLWEKEKRNADFKENLKMSIFHVNFQLKREG